MIKIYGREDCHDCVDCKASFDINGIEYDFHDIGKSLQDMAAFIKIRDLNTVFEPIKGTGKIGIQVLITDENEFVLEWEKYLSDKGFSVVKAGQVCSIDGKGC